MDFETKLDASQLDRNNIPQSIAIIMDGNGRWAQEKGLPRSSGHLQGVDNVHLLHRKLESSGSRSKNAHGPCS